MTNIFAFADDDNHEIGFFIETILTEKQMKRILSESKDDKYDDDIPDDVIQELILAKDKKARIIDNFKTLEY